MHSLLLFIHSSGGCVPVLFHRPLPLPMDTRNSSRGQRQGMDYSRERPHVSVRIRVLVRVRVPAVRNEEGIVRATRQALPMKR